MKVKLLKKLRKEAKKAVRVSVCCHPCGHNYDINAKLPLSSYDSWCFTSIGDAEQGLYKMRSKYIRERVLAERAKRLNDK